VGVESLSRSNNPLGQAWQDVGRFQAIVAVLIRHGFGELISRMNLQDNIITRMLGSAPQEPVRDVSMPKRLSLVCQELGPTFIKLGQILSTRPDLIPDEYIQEFKKLQSQAAPLPFSAVSSEIEEALGQPLDELFASFEEEPLASASIAQVHTAVLPDGTEVVVKVRRPGIEEMLQSDLSILIFLAKRIEQIFPDAELFDPVGIAEEFERAISKELDFTVEARNLERFASNFSNNPDIHIPKVYKSCSCRSVLVMERLRGVKITDITTGQKEIVRRLLRAVFEMIYVHALFHGDLHPGNIIIEEDGRIGLIDLGLVGRLTPRMRERVTDLIMGLIQTDYESVAETLYDIGIIRTHINYERFENDVAVLMDEYLIGSTMAEIEFGRLFQELIDGAMRHNISVPPDYTMMFKALITAEGVGKQLDPEMDLLTELKPYVMELARERYSPDKLLKKGLRNLNQLGRLMNQFPITARQVLMGVEDGRIKFGLDSHQFDAFLSEYRQQNNRKVQTALAALLLLVGVLALDVGKPTFFFQLPVISSWAFLLGGILGSWVLLGTFRDG
jgi:ubiquinone biosynthesis protein